MEFLRSNASFCCWFTRSIVRRHGSPLMRGLPYNPVDRPYPGSGWLFRTSAILRGEERPRGRRGVSIPSAANALQFPGSFQR
jgi:hypothetical protein